MTCYSLISCYPLIYPDILSLSSALLADYVGQVVYINGDNDRHYTVTFVEGEEDCLDPIVIESVVAVPDCPPLDNFRASLLDDSGVVSIDINDSCSGLVITDNSNYDVNGSPGHLRPRFTDFRRVHIIGPSSEWVMSSIPDDTTADQVIPAPSIGTDEFAFSFQDVDSDGIYEVRLCTYPTWTDLAQYPSSPLNVVYYEGVLYRCIQDSTDNVPDENPEYWEVYEPTPEEALLTRYCTVQRVVVLCISLLKCYEKLVHDAFCLMDNNFCNDDVLCKNKKFLAATKMMILLKAVEISVNKNAWHEVEKQIRLMKLICGCR
jgi:hypothetical protein